MLEIVFTLDPANVAAASDWLSSETERLEMARARNITIHYPERFARALGIAENDRLAAYRGYPAIPNNNAPYVVIIKHDG